MPFCHVINHLSTFTRGAPGVGVLVSVGPFRLARSGTVAGDPGRRVASAGECTRTGTHWTAPQCTRGPQYTGGRTVTRCPRRRTDPNLNSGERGEAEDARVTSSSYSFAPARTVRRDCSGCLHGAGGDLGTAGRRWGQRTAWPKTTTMTTRRNRNHSAGPPNPD